MPDTPSTSAWPPSLPSVPTSRATRVTSSANDESWSTIVLIVCLQLEDLARASTVDLLGQVAVGDRGGDLGDVAHLAGQVAGHELTLSVRSFQVPATPGTCGLAAEVALGADLAGDAGDLVGERATAGRPSC